jgi:serine/threonine protein kinase
LEKKVDKKIGLPSKGTKQTVEKKQRLTLKENKPIAITKTKINAIGLSNGTIISDVGVITSDVVVPGYKIMRKIAQGGMASVYLAERSEDQLQVILKIINFIDDETEELFKRFIREYILVSKLNHPNIICVYERKIVSKYAYIAMVYCPTGDLSDRLDKALPTETAVSYIRQIADGIGAAHKAGIIHHDMKPANILFRADDSVAIADFGIAKLQSVENNITNAGFSLGTILYISPEQICTETVGRYSDLYSLGIIFYKMLTGEYPFFSNSVEQILKAHLKSRVPKLPSKLARFQPVINRLLAKNPDERFQNVEEFIVGFEWN